MNYLEKNRREFIKDLKGLISIQSWLKEVNKYPTKEIKNGLSFMENLAKREGFKYYTDPDGYYGWMEIGSGEEMIGILGHIDVVPPGDLSEWDNEPFSLTEKGDKLFGRGTQDDKGPVMLAFYLLKELAKSHKNMNKRVRLIYPTDEESFWRGVEKYIEKEESPSFGITPDSSYPIIYSERALLNFKVIGEPVKDYTIKGGTAVNVVPSKSKYKKGDEEVVAIGKSAHAMNPEKGVNAITKLFKEISEKVNHPLIDFVNKELNLETNAKTFLGKVYKDSDAEITCNLGVVSIDSKSAELIIDMRLPNGLEKDELVKMIKNKISKYKGLKYEHYDWLKGVFIPKDSFVIKDLIESYKEITNKNMKPISVGGATYARAMDNIVAFGPFFEDSPETEHQYNEYILFSDLSKSFDIYLNVFNKWLKK